MAEWIDVPRIAGPITVGMDFGSGDKACTVMRIGEQVVYVHHSEPEQPSEQAHMMAAPANLSGQGMLDNSIIAERDALRAEVERLTQCLQRANDQAEHFEREWYLRGDEIERLRKGREDEKGAHTTAEAARVEDARKLAPIHADLAKAKTLASNFTDLDPRLGMPQPEGEPVGPMSARKAYRWGMV